MTRRGVTLVELLVVLAIIGFTVLAAVPIASRPGDRPVAASVALRTAAIRDGRVRPAEDSMMRPARLAAYPDGLLIADSVLRLDPFSGRSQPDSVHATR